MDQSSPTDGLVGREPVPSLRIGEAVIYRVEEQQVARPIGRFAPCVDPVLPRFEALPGGFLDPEQLTFQFCFQSWLVCVDGLRVLVDPGNGNGRVRPGYAQFGGLDTPWLERLAATGTQPGDVDLVFCTHLHCDHCGWNTYDVDGEWRPTFPNARYVFVDREYERWDPGSRLGPDEQLSDHTPSVFDEAVRPIAQAGLAVIVAAPHQISPSLRIESAAGHTRGHCVLRLESAGELAYFTGDVVHHPVQIFAPELHLPGDDDLRMAVATRRSLLQRICDERAVLVPVHFAEPHHGRIVSDVGGLGFEAGGATE